jgi:cyclophilin family peptidyl-prolyl cis-trans isomerase/HEAT repeat protein
VNRSLVLLSLIVCLACSEKKKESLPNIADLQDRRNTDSLLIYLSSEDTVLRKKAALAFASVQDTSAIGKLGELKDIEAVFALGQMYSNRAVDKLKSHINEPGNQREAYEALGKVMRSDDLDLFSTETKDTSALAGIAWGIYRAGVRGVSDSASVNRALAILADPTSGRSARLGAAQFFSRAPYRQTAPIATVLNNVSNDADAEIRMAVVNALGKVKEELGIAGLTRAVDDSDYRVRVNAMRALRAQPWNVSKPLFEKAFKDPNVNVHVAAAEVIINIAPAKDAKTILSWAKAESNWRAQALLYECVAKLKVDVEQEVMELYKNSTNDYQKAALLSVLKDVDFIFTEYKNNQAKIIKSTAAGEIAGKSTDINIYKQIIADGDQGSIIPICDALRDSTTIPRKSVTDYSFLEEAKNKLSLPRDYETYVPLERTLNYFKGQPPPKPLKNEFNHPIDWNLAATIAKDQHVLIETTKGDIVMKLFIDEAPGSVVNFVNLVNTDYFNGRFFHRVVPNFVIQTGCNRGDGFGSEDYSIRSEFSRRRYKTGSVGMASAGKDTEGTQWFITHSPTPHLDGKYTIFAEVVKGMDVVDQIEVGDKIIKAIVIEY